MIAGPALAGLLLARWGAVGAYVFDPLTFRAALYLIARIPRERIGQATVHTDRPHLPADLAEGLRFAWARPALMGTSMPVIGLFSGWTGKVVRHDRAVVTAAAIRALGIVALGFAPSLALALVCLAGIEMISSLTGPLVGNARAGFMADAGGVSASIWIGGVVCLVGVVATGFVLPRFWADRSTVVTPAAGGAQFPKSPAAPADRQSRPGYSPPRPAPRRCARRSAAPAGAARPGFHSSRWVRWPPARAPAGRGSRQAA